MRQLISVNYDRKRENAGANAMSAIGRKHEQLSVNADTHTLTRTHTRTTSAILLCYVRNAVGKVCWLTAFSVSLLVIM